MESFKKVVADEDQAESTNRVGSHYRMLDIRSHTETDNFGEAFCPSLPCELFLVPVPLKDLTIMHLQIDIFICTSLD